MDFVLEGGPIDIFKGGGNMVGTCGVGGACGVMVIVVGNGHGNKFKFWTRLIAFHIALIPFGNV